MFPSCKQHHVANAAFMSLCSHAGRNLQFFLQHLQFVEMYNCYRPLQFSDNWRMVNFLVFPSEGLALHVVGFFSKEIPTELIQVNAAQAGKAKFSGADSWLTEGGYWGPTCNRWLGSSTITFVYVNYVPYTTLDHQALQRYNPDINITWWLHIKGSLVWLFSYLVA